MRHLLARVSGVTVLAVAMASGCSAHGSRAEFTQPPVSAFRDGSCRTMAPDVLAIGRDARRLGTTNAPPQETRDALKAAQTRIRALQPGLDPSLSKPVENLVESVGIVRLLSDTKGFTPALATDLSTAVKALVDTCTSGH